MNKPTLFVFIGLLVIIIVLLAMIIFTPPAKVVVTNDKIYKDSIAALQTKIDSSRVRQKKLEQAYDSLLAIDPPVIYRTHEKIKFILTDASPDELDIIIRSAWKTKSRYR